MTDPSMLDIALFHASEGFRVIPLHTAYPESKTCSCGRPDCGNAIGKHPRISDWQVLASRDPEVIKSWWTAFPMAGIGLAMGGMERLVALDVDGPQGREALEGLESVHGPLPRTRTHRSGRTDGGEHRIFRVPLGLDIAAVRNNASKIAPKLDVRSEGGQIVAPGTVHVSGARYEIADDAPIAELPQWIYDLCAASGAKKVMTVTPREVTEDDVNRARWMVERALDKLKAAKPGERNNTLNEVCYTIGGILDYAGYTVEAVKGRISSVALGLGLSAAEVAATLEHSLDDGAANPLDFDAWDKAIAEAEKTEFERLRDDLRDAKDKGEHLYSSKFLAGVCALTGVHLARLRTIVKAELAGLSKTVGAESGSMTDWDRELKRVEGTLRVKPKAAKGVEDDRPIVEVVKDGFKVVDEVLTHVGQRLDVYQRGNVLVTLRNVRDVGKEIAEIEPEHFWEMAQRACYFVKIIDTDNGPQKIHIGGEVPKDILSAALSRPDYGDEIRPIDGVAKQPLLLPSGEIVGAPGYHSRARVFLDFDPSAFLETPASPSREDALAGIGFLEDVFRDFPLEDRARDLSVILSLILTAVGLDAFTGPSPLHVFDGTDPGVGKTLIAQLCSIIASGDTAPAGAWHSSPEEWEKAELSAAIKGKRFALIDNVTDGAELRSVEFEKFLTSTRTVGRVLGASKELDLPYRPVRALTGNNVRMGGALDRRSLVCRLQKTWETPEERRFSVGDLEGWVRGNRGDLYCVALMVLRAYIVAGKPLGLVPLPSFEGWSRLVAGCLVWLGRANPIEKVASKDEAVENPLEDLIGGLREVVAKLQADEPKRKTPRGYILAGGFTAKDVFDIYQTSAANFPSLQKAVETLLTDWERKDLTAKRLGTLISSKRESPSRGAKLTYLINPTDGKPWREHNTSIWCVEEKKK